jgi:PPM family protein phosphatase
LGYRIGVVCDRGVPAEAGGRKRNEDSFLVCARNEVRYRADDQEFVQSAKGDGVLIGVFDGMGGHQNGDVASSTAARVLAKLYQPGAPSRPARVLLRFLRESHDALHLKAKSPDGKANMGTTATVGWLLQGQLHWAHVGDSRLYLWRQGRIDMITEDQTRNAFLARDNKPLRSDGDRLCQSFIFGSRGLGHDAILRLEHGLDSGSESLEVGDRLLWCSDGVTGVLDAERLREILGQSDDPQELALALTTTAMSAGSVDNITAVVVVVDDTPVDDVAGWTDDGEETVRF